MLKCLQKDDIFIMLSFTNKPCSTGRMKVLSVSMADKWIEDPKDFDCLRSVRTA
jgi:hypothetical protein